jgi:hypothetical protein
MTPTIVNGIPIICAHPNGSSKKVMPRRIPNIGTRKAKAFARLSGARSSAENQR